MPSIVYHTDKKSGNTYAYESTSFRDPQTKQVKTKKTYIGRVDPLTKEIIPKAEPGKRNRQPSNKQLNQISEAAKNQIESLSNEVNELKSKIGDLNDQLKIKDDFIQTVIKASEKYQVNLSK